MDPNETWLQFRRALGEADLTDACRALSDLREWLEKGGFPPTGVTNTEILHLEQWLNLLHLYDSLAAKL